MFIGSHKEFGRSFKFQNRQQRMKQRRSRKPAFNLDLDKKQEFPSLNACQAVIFEKLAQETWIDRQRDPDPPGAKERFHEAASKLDFEELQKLVAGKVPLTFRLPEPGWRDPQARRNETLYSMLAETCKQLGIPEANYLTLRPRESALQKVFPNPEIRLLLPDFEPEADPKHWRGKARSMFNACLRSVERDLANKAARIEKSTSKETNGKLTSDGARHLTREVFALKGSGITSANLSGEPLVRRHRARRKRDVPLEQKIEWLALHDFKGWSIERLRKDKNPKKVTRQAIQSALRDLRQELAPNQRKVTPLQP